MRLLCDQKHWQSQRGLKGLGKVLLKSSKGLRSIAGPNWSRAAFWACTKDWLRLIWSLRGFIGCLEVSKRSYVSCWSVSPWKGRGSSQCRCDLSVTVQRWGGDRSVLYRRLVGDQLQSGFQACAIHSAMGLQTSPTCLRMTASFSNKCSKSSDWLSKMVCKSSRKKDLLAIQGLNWYCLRLLLINRLYTIMATIAAFWFSLCRHSNCNCQHVKILKTCKEMIWLWKASFLYAFVMIENRSTVSHQSVTDHSPTRRRPVSTDRKPVAVCTVNSCR